MLVLVLVLVLVGAGVGCFDSSCGAAEGLGLSSSLPLGRRMGLGLGDLCVEEGSGVLVVLVGVGCFDSGGGAEGLGCGVLEDAVNEALTAGTPPPIDDMFLVRMIATATLEETMVHSKIR